LICADVCDASCASCVLTTVRNDQSFGRDAKLAKLDVQSAITGFMEMRLIIVQDMIVSWIIRLLYASNPDKYYFFVY